MLNALHTHQYLSIRAFFLNRWTRRQFAGRRPFGASSFAQAESPKGDHREPVTIEEMHELSCLTDDEQRLQVQAPSFFHIFAFYTEKL